MADDRRRTQRATPEDSERRLRLTERDRTIARLVARWGPLTQPQVARGAQMSRLPSFRRLQALRDAGYLTYDRPVDALAGVFSATANGVELAGLVREASGAPPAYALWSHLAAADVAITAELEGVRAANRLEILADASLRSRVPTTMHGSEIAPRVLILDVPAVAVYAVLRPASAPAGVADELVAATLEAYAALIEGETRVRIIASSELADAPGILTLRKRPVEVVLIEPGEVGRDP